MISTLTATATAALTRSFTFYARYSSWLGDTLLATDIPVDSGNESADRSSAVAERVELTVPLRHRGTSWAPTADLSPLAANGQRIKVELGIGLNSTQIEWFQRGEFVIVDVDVDDTSVQLTCAGLMYLIEEARLVSPYQPSGTLTSTIRALVEPAVPVVFDSTLIDRSVPAGMNFDESRIDGLGEVCDAWPADYVMTAEGYLYVYNTAVARTPVTTISSGLVEVAGRSTREGAYNTVVARGQTTSQAQFQAVAYDTSGGPKSFGGPFNPLPVPYYFSSPLLTTVPQASAAANSILRRLQRDTSRAFQVEMVPDPRLQVGDLVTLQCTEYSGQAEIDKIRLPYGPGMAMTLDLRTVVI